MKYYRRIIKIGNSIGVTLPKKEIPINLDPGDFVKITIEKVR